MSAPVQKWGRLCASCDEPLDATALRRNLQWGPKCRVKRLDPVKRKAAAARFHQRHRDRRLAQSAAYYTENKDVLAMKQKVRRCS